MKNNFECYDCGYEWEDVENASCCPKCGSSSIENLNAIKNPYKKVENKK